MVPYEYHLYSRGFSLREQIEQVPFRRLWQLLYNVHAKNQITGSAIASYWSLPDIDRAIMGMDDMDARREEWAVMVKASKERNARQLELQKRQQNEQGRHWR